jgi:LPXTG-motif cell wall-anchored protein
MRLARIPIAVLATLFAVASLVMVAPSASAVPPYPSRCVLSTSTFKVLPGQQVTVMATGFPAGATVTFTMALTNHKGPTMTLGSAVANSAGVATLVFTVNPATTPGMYTITATGPATSDCSPLISTHLMVDAAAVATPTTAISGSLPRTGTNSAWLFQIALLLIALGGLVTLGARKRLQRATVES